jgi:hypothetical protein
MITIGSLSLDKNYTPVVNSTNEYYKSSGGEIIGGYKLIKITGSVVVGGAGKTGATVMSTMRKIVDLGKTTKCIPVVVPGYYAGLGKINNVTADQGSDPTWINKASYSIEIKVPLDKIPPNSFGIVAKDCVVEINRSSKIDLGEDSHGYIYKGGLFSKVFATATTELSLKCEPLCGANNFFDVVKKLIKQDLHPLLGTYSNWNKYAKGLSVQVGPENSATITKQHIITPHPSTAFVDLSFNHERSYQDKNTSKIISGTITGLTNDIFGDTTISGTCSASRLGNAELVLLSIRAMYGQLGSWEGILLELIEKPNCPKKPTVPSTGCSNNEDDEDNSNCIKPKSSVISRSRTEGTINFTFEWASPDNSDCTVNGIRKDVSVEVIEPQLQIVEHVIPLKGTLIQSLNTVNAKKINITISKTFPENSCVVPCEEEEESDDTDIQSLLEKYGDGSSYILIEDRLVTTNQSITINKGFIECNSD